MNVMGNGNGNAPWWAKASLLSFVVLYLLGAVPGLKSPMDRIIDSFDKGTAAIVAAVHARDDKIERLIEAVSCPHRP